MVSNISKEELNGMIYETIQNNHHKTESLSDRCFSLPANTIEFLDCSIQLSSLLSTNMWLTQNSDCASVDELNYRIQKFQSIIEDERFHEIEDCMEIACFAHLFLKNTISFRKKYVELLNNHGLSLGYDPFIIEQKFLSKGLSLINDFLSDDKILSAEKICNFNLYGVAHKGDWNAVDYYKINEINKATLHGVQNFFNQLKQHSISEKNK